MHASKDKKRKNIKINNRLSFKEKITDTRIFINILTEYTLQNNCGFNAVCFNSIGSNEYQAEITRSSLGYIKKYLNQKGFKYKVSNTKNRVCTVTINTICELQQNQETASIRRAS